MKGKTNPKFFKIIMHVREVIAVRALMNTALNQWVSLNARNFLAV